MGTATGSPPSSDCSDTLLRSRIAWYVRPPRFTSRLRADCSRVKIDFTKKTTAVPAPIDASESESSNHTFDQI
jgi:hypothetical protein